MANQKITPEAPNAEILAAYTRCYERIQAGKITEGMECIDKLVTKYPESIDLSYWISTYLIQTARSSEGRTNELQQFEQRFPTDPRTILLRAEYWNQEGDKSKALKEYEEYTDRFNPSEAVIARKARVLDDLGRRDEALDLVRDRQGARCIALFYKLCPPSTEVEADIMVSKLQKSYSTPFEVTKAACTAFDRLLLPSRTKEALVSFLSNHPDNEWACIRLGMAEEALGRTDEAIEIYRKLLAANPYEERTARHLIELYIRNNKIGKAIGVAVRKRPRRK